MPYLSIMSPFGDLTLFEEDDQLVSLDWGRAASTGCSATPLLIETKRQLDAYFDGELVSFDLPLGLPDSPFAARVRDAMLAIPYGQVRSYGELARTLSVSPRAVGGACSRNPLPIIVPCHRVVAADSLGGYSGLGGLETKRRLLTLEGWIEHEALLVT